MTKESKFIAVPGNHDLNCSDTLPINWEGLGKTRQELFWNTDERGTNIRKNRSVGFREYAQFLKQCNIFGPDGVVEVGTVVTINTKTPATIICLNTALFTDKELSERDELEKSPMPVHVLRQLMQEEEFVGQTFVIGHHPTRWFEAQSRQHFLSALSELNAVYLHGHEHAIDASFGPHYLRTLGFGATYPARLDSRERQPYTSPIYSARRDDVMADMA